MLLRFADCELDPAQRTLRRGGPPVDVDPKAFDLLLLLAERGGALLPRSEMLRALWPDTAVSAAAVSQCVRRARVAIGDDDRGTRRIETLNRHGLRLAVPVAFAEPAPPPEAHSAFVGRAGELARLEADFETARTGRSRVALVAGEAGIGKTRLVEELLGRCAVRGAAIAWGRCHEDVEMPSYWPWVQATRTLTSALAPRGLDVGDLPLVSRLLPDRGGPHAGAEPAGTPDAFALYDQWVRLFAALAGRAPLVIALDDLQWTDARELGLDGLEARIERARGGASLH